MIAGLPPDGADWTKNNPGLPRLVYEDFVDMFNSEEGI